MTRKSKISKGDVFASLTVLGDSGRRRNTKVVWSCVCTCGKNVLVRTDCLKYAWRQSCGCKRIKNQIRTRRNLAHKVEYRGKEYTYRELADLAGLSTGTIRSRLGKGWSIEKTVECVRFASVEVDGKFFTWQEFSTYVGVSTTTVYNRLQAGWTVDELVQGLTPERRKELCKKVGRPRSEEPHKKQRKPGGGRSRVEPDLEAMKEAVELLQNDRFISAARLAEKLGVSASKFRSFAQTMGGFPHRLKPPVSENRHG